METTSLGDLLNVECRFSLNSLAGEVGPWSGVQIVFRWTLRSDSAHLGLLGLSGYRQTAANPTQGARLPET